MRPWLFLILFSFLLTPRANAQNNESPPPWAMESLLGGATTYISKFPTVQAYRNPLANLTPEQMESHLFGDALFERKFSDDPTRADYGLGPVYNNISCAACHVRDGRGALPVVPLSNAWTKLGIGDSIFLRISIEDDQPRARDASDNWGAPIAVPGFSDQLFHLGSFRARQDTPGSGQADVWMKFEYSDFVYPDGTKITLRKPIFEVRNPYDLTTDGQSRLFKPDVRFSPRMTPGMIGLGLIEAIPDAAIETLARRDLSAWGIHGKINRVIDRQKYLNGELYPIAIGRFGLKASTPTVYHQSLGALVGDIGVTNPAFPEESIARTPLFDTFKKYWKPGMEADASVADGLVFYSQTLAVPERRDVKNPEVIRGATLFRANGCVLCHQPDFTTSGHAIAELNGHRIYPFSDFLLHDMGDGLADGREDFLASGREWKTRPLWGIGLTQVVNPRAGFLHDGRARTMEEAILWHGGEAEISKSRFVNMTAKDRGALLRFLKSL